MQRLLVVGLLITAFGCHRSAPSGMAAPAVVVMQTSMGTIRIQLDAEKAPLTTANFLHYVDQGFYDLLIFHRVINGFMIQGGGFNESLMQKPPDAPVKNESANGLQNVRGSVAMARTSNPDSATSQFFINVADNHMLDYPETGGYTVFGKVIDGMDVVDRIKAVPTISRNRMENVPVTPVFIESVKRAP